MMGIILRHMASAQNPASRGMSALSMKKDSAYALLLDYGAYFLS